MEEVGILIWIRAMELIESGQAMSEDEAYEVAWKEHQIRKNNFLQGIARDSERSADYDEVKREGVIDECKQYDPA